MIKKAKNVPKDVFCVTIWKIEEFSINGGYGHGRGQQPKLYCILYVFKRFNNHKSYGFVKEKL